MATSGRKFFVGGNWKCNGGMDAVSKLVKGLSEAAPSLPSTAEVVVAPSFLYLDYVRKNIAPYFAVAAQNCWGKKGAYTGEVAAELIKDFGLNWVVLGHSERRHVVVHETDEQLAAKTDAALAAGLNVIFCIGELEQERETNATEAVLARQMEAVAKAIPAADLWAPRIVIAYEPVWAIGTGKTASPQQAQDAHAFTRKWLADHVSPAVAAATRIIYGGSVTPANADELASQPDVDGFLVGGASLDDKKFIPIIQSVKQKSK